MEKQMTKISLSRFVEGVDVLRRCRVFVLILVAFVSSLSLIGCASGLETRSEIAKELAQSQNFSERQIPAAPFMLTAQERITAPGMPINIYIEGDGLAWLSKREISLNPTPKNPVALKLAAADPSANVVYLARPCQYSGMMDSRAACDPAYWTQKRFAPEVLTAYNAALDDIKQRSGASGFALTGFSGGGAIATILAAQRNDVLSLRTVAGNLDHRAHSAYHKVDRLEDSLNPPEFAARLVQIPQVHFIGAEDDNVTERIFQSYVQALPSNFCVQHKIVSGASHTEGWDKQWRSLLLLQPGCRTPV
jgi:dienelactone hydrolase